ncbi:MAG: hypothetical protein AAFY65_13075 [Pseudomonadota bacterium]
MFVIDTHPKFTTTVAVQLGDATEPSTFQATFVALPAEELKSFDTATEEGTEALLVRVIDTLDDLVDEEGKAVSYTVDLRDTLLGLPWVRQPLVRAYFTELARARLGN